MKHFITTSIVSAFLLIMFSNLGWGQLGTYSGGSTSASGVASNITFGTLVRGSGVGAQTASGYFVSSNWDNSTRSAARTANEYHGFSVQANSGYQVTYTSFTFTVYRTNAGPTICGIGYSTDGGTNWTDSPDYNITSASTDYTFTWDFNDFTTSSNVLIRLYGWSASSTGNLRSKDFILNGNVNSIGNTIPSLTSPITSNVSNLSIILGATISSNGGVAISESGIVYGTSANPTGNATVTSPTVTSGAFTVSVSSLTPQTLYYYRGYAVNSIGTGYSPDGTFRTLSNPPTVQASNLSGTIAGTTVINLNWTAATFPVSGATTTGYVLLRASGSNTPSLSNGNGVAPTAGPNTTIVSSSLTGTNYQNTGLTINTAYNYLLIPFCWDGTNAATYNYLTTSAPSFTISTPSNVSDVVSVISSESTSISSLMNDPAPLTSTTGTQVWQFTIRDGGSGANDGDNLPTIVTGFTLTQNSGNAVDNWADAIKTAAIFDGTTFIASASSITSYTIIFSGLNLTIPDNSNKTISIRLSLNSTLNSTGTGNLDGDDFVFNITNSNITTATDGTSSVFSSFSTASSTNGNNALDIVATKLVFLQQPTNVTTNTNMSPAVTVKATDIGGNVDRNFVSSISLTSTGSTLIGSPVSSTATAGIASFSSLQFTEVASGVYLTASYSGFTDVNSNTFDVTLPLSAYSYRSKQTGNWNDINSWERTSDGSNWTSISSSSDLPNSSAGSIRILSGHTITISSSISVDELIIDASGQLTVSSGQTLTIANGTGTDATINGTLKNSGTISNNGQIIFGSGSIYEHNINGGTIPQASWDVNSTVLVTGVTSTNPTFSATDSYGNLTWNCSSQTGTINLIGGLRTIMGSFTLISTGSSELRLLGNLSGITISINGDLILQGGTLVFSNGSAINGTLSLGGNFNISSGATFDGNSSNSMTFAFTGANKNISNSGSIASNSYINWVINTGASIFLNSDFVIATSRTLTLNGLLYLKNKVLTVDGSITALTPDNTKMVVLDDGTNLGTLKLKVSNNAGYTFPVGDTRSGANFTPATVTFSGTTFSSAYLALSMSAVIEPHNSSSTDYITRNWTFTPTGLSNLGYTISLKYADADVHGTESNIWFGKYDAGTWALLNKPDINNNTFTSLATLTSFSTFTGGEQGVLPVRLSTLTSCVDRRNITLTWSTSSETNNSGFDVERRNVTDNNWVKTGFVRGNGTTGNLSNYSFTDRGLNTGKYKYRLKQVDYNGNYEYFELSGTPEVGVPDKYNISQNYPNPFNPVTKIDIDIPFDSKVSLTLYDVTGREIKNLIGSEMKAGYYTHLFDASSLSSGVYFYRVVMNSGKGNFVTSKKMVVLK